MNLLSWQNITLRKRSWDLNICNKFSNGVILRNKKNNMCSGRREKMKRGTRICFGLKLKIEWVGRGWKKLDQNDGWVKMSWIGMSWTKRYALWIQFFSITDDDFLLVPRLTTLYWQPQAAGDQGQVKEGASTQGRWRGQPEKVKKGESRTGGQNREAQNRSPDVQTSDFLTRTRKILGRSIRNR